jgi:integral membrane sensor domain MASE1
MLPGILFAIVGIVLFIFLETDDSYWYIHSLWHICMASAILFLLPQRISKIIEEKI